MAGVVIAVAAWALLAFAGAYRWTTVPIFVAAGLLAGLVRPIPFTPPHRLLDVVLVASVGVIGVQLIPLPPALRTTLAPAAAAIDRALLLNSGSDDGAARPLSIDPESTFWSLGLGVALLLIFWSARTLFERHGGLRTVSRGVAFLGLGLAALVFLQRALSPRLIYGIWQPLTQSNASPWGPFVNRNDAAMWFVMALPLAAGYALARLESLRATAMKRLAPDEAFDAVMAMLLTSVSLMTAAVLTSLSRSGLLGLAVSVAVMIGVARGRLARAKGVLIVTAAVVSVAVAAYANLPALATRVADALPTGFGGRIDVWRQTWPMARDFVLAGIGVGGYLRGMLVYQQSTRLIFINHAHNEYLQILVEGGLLLAVPAAAAVIAAAIATLRRLRCDRTPVFWLRAGAASGMAAVAAQCLWETGLRMPANAVLLAVIAAIALHAPPDSGSPSRT